MSIRSRIPDPLLAVLVAVGLALVAYGGGNVLAVVAAFLLRFFGVELTPRYLVVLSTITIQLIAFTGISLAYLRYRDMSVADIGVRVPSLEGWIALGVGFVGMIVLWLVGSIGTFLIRERFGIEGDTQMLFEMAQQDPLIFLIAGALSIFIVGPAEELLFRGIIQSRLRETFGARAGVTIATVLFAAMHITGFGSLAGGLLGVSVLFFVGLALAITYEYTDNLVVVAIMHGLFNAIQMTLGYFSLQYADPDAVTLLVETAIATPLI